MLAGTLQCRQDCYGGVQCAEVHTEQHPSVRIHGSFQDNLIMQERRVHVSQMSGGGKWVGMMGNGSVLGRGL